MDPIGGAALLEDELIEIAMRTIGDVKQDACHTDHLLRAIATDIDRAACQVITPLGSPTFPIHLLTPIP